VIVFNDIVTNIGNGYNVHGGVFTTRVKGVYIFAATILTTIHNLGVQIVQDGRELCRAYASYASHDSPGSCLATVHLAVGDDVWVREYGYAGVVEGGWSSLSGFLIFAD
jgi:hypothetical protein